MPEVDLESLWLVIPTASRFNHLNSIFESSGIPPERRILIRTTPGKEFPGAINLFQESIFNIQTWWNTGIDYVAQHGGKYVAVLNDDAEFQAGTLQTMLNQMVEEGSDLVHPDPILNNGWGHCWILRIQSKVRPDERFIWWCGDHDLQFQALRGGGVSISSVNVLNLYANVLTSRDAKFEAIINSDIRVFRRKYPIHAIRQYLKRITRRTLGLFTSR